MGRKSVSRAVPSQRERTFLFLEAAFKLVDNVELTDMGERFSIDIVDFYTDVDSHNEDLKELHT
ncbi:hypothetical protein [Sphingobacterium gobiense]|uniref:Uncharacterized protein n=1 Tax=Sphingobacterium gobiense TaxID=1382456 RepID=A0A2S9JHW5_9SPHI|nr:hypothetical protein [Sphingobacterium gobiense]PRD52605.1 hypothetical protein C5749_15350 [Sphingobacterium gobiense]